MPETVIWVGNLYKTFRVKQKSPGLWGGVRAMFRPDYREIKAVDNVSFSVNRGELLAFIGPNGAGKSTTIKMLCGILYPTSGELSVLDFNPAISRQKLAYRIGSVFGQKPQLWYHLAAQDTYNLLQEIYDLAPNDYRTRLSFLVDAFEIGDLLKMPVRKLSLGQRMRCEIVAALLHRPEVIFLDEPTIGLDVIAKQHIREVIRYLNEKEKVTIFLTSHDAGDIETLATRTVVINFGRLVFDGATSELKKKYIQTKVVELVVGEPIQQFSFPGGRVTEQTRFNLKIELDTTQNSIDKLLDYAVAQLDIKDINIFDPPMEEIIADIYRAKESPAARNTKP
ncbi:MAG: ABC transporter ATP-binding protein [Candidatus Liptonbacteria bacterium]|nr:ABC transporter ATP-binding protein [Candidatus Liptonbacteria bacterium]